MPVAGMPSHVATEKPAVVEGLAARATVLQLVDVLLVILQVVCSPKLLLAVLAPVRLDVGVGGQVSAQRGLENMHATHGTSAFQFVRFGFGFGQVTR